MRSYFHKGGWWLTGLSVATFVGVHVVKNQEPARPWYDTALFVAIFVGLVVAIVTTDTVWKALAPRVRAAWDYLPSIHAPKRRLRFRKRYDVDHARALVGAGRMGERLSETFDVGEPEITPKSVSYRLGPKERPRSELAKAAAAQEPETLPTHQPTIEPSMAPVLAAQAHVLMQEAQPLIDDAWNIALRMKRSVGVEIVSTEYANRLREWNSRVVALADQTLSVKERAKVHSMKSGLGAVAAWALNAQKAEEIVNHNLETLRLIEKRCLA